MEVIRHEAVGMYLHPETFRCDAQQPTELDSVAIFEEDDLPRHAPIHDMVPPELLLASLRSSHVADSDSGL